MTTIGSQLYPASEAERILAFLLMVYAIAGFSYLMASLASVLVGNDASKEPRPQQEKVLVTVQLSREQLETLRQVLKKVEAS